MIIKRDIQFQRVGIECADAYAPMADNVLDVFEQLANAGSSIASGMQIRFGWSLLHLLAGADGLRVAEPDFARWPERHWNPTLDITLDVLAAQTSLLRHFDIEGEDVFYDQVILAAPGSLAQPNIFLRRAAYAMAEDSGWLLGSLEDPEALSRAEELDAVSIASLVYRHPALLQALTLPPGFIAVFADSVLQQIYDAAGRALK